MRLRNLALFLACSGYAIECGGGCGGAPYDALPIETQDSSPAPEAAPDAGRIDSCSCEPTIYSRDQAGNVALSCPSQVPGYIVQGQREFTCTGCLGPAGYSCHVAPSDYPADITMAKHYCCFPIGDGG